jgi:hypothetical protein
MDTKKQYGRVKKKTQTKQFGHFLGEFSPALILFQRKQSLGSVHGGGFDALRSSTLGVQMPKVSKS